MKVLNLEESKKIVTQFLKYIGRYYPEKTNNYFDIKKRRFIIELPVFIIGKKSIYNCLWFPQNKNEKTIQNYFESYIAFNFDVLKNNIFFDAIRMSLEKKEISGLYAAADFWIKRREWDKHLINLESGELTKDSILIQGMDTYFFSKDFDFLFIITHENFVLFLSSKKIMKSFKDCFKNYKNDLYYEDHAWGFPLEK